MTSSPPPPTSQFGPRSSSQGYLVRLRTMRGYWCGCRGRRGARGRPLWPVGAGRRGQTGRRPW
eukprot:209870-Pyramimonas_sp.AAC.1